MNKKSACFVFCPQDPGPVFYNSDIVNKTITKSVFSQVDCVVTFINHGPIFVAFLSIALQLYFPM